MFGWAKDKFDKRDYIAVPMRAAILPDVINWVGDLPEVRDQGSIGSCVGWGIGGNLCARAKVQGVFSEWFSATWIYNGARYIEGTLSQDAGAMPRDALDFLVSRGCLLEHFWPYTGKLDKHAPPSKYDVETAKYPMLSYTRVTGDVDGICSALAQGYCVSIGAAWFSKWMNPSNDGRLAEVTERDAVAGGHETFLFGFDRIAKLFFGMNSWGLGWGNKGHYLLPFSAINAFKATGGYDAHYVDVNWGIVPPGPPVPPSPRDEVNERLEALEYKLTVLDRRIADAGSALKG